MAEKAANCRLLLVIARHQDALDELITGLLDAGVEGATVIDSRGMGQLLREEMPIFAGLASLLPQTTGSRIVFSVTNDGVIARLKSYIAEMDEESRPIAIVIPVQEVFGLGGDDDDSDGGDDAEQEA